MECSHVIIAGAAFIDRKVDFPRDSLRTINKCPSGHRGLDD